MKRLTIQILALLLVGLPLLEVFAKDTSAASSRVAIIKEMKGTVKVKKAGGSKEFTAFAKMSLNEGDIVAVGAGGSAVLQFSNGTSEDDKMTVSSNTTLAFSKLSNSKGTTTKVSMFNGSAWVDVKSITNKEDQFTLETPTAVMGVRGTHLLVSVDPVSGATRLMVAAGVVTTQTTTPGDEPQNVLPTQNALITKDDKGASNITIAQVDIELLMKQSDKNIISAVIQASLDIDAENKAKSNQYENIDQNASNETYKKNVSNIVGALITQALDSNIIDQQRLNELVAQVKAATGVDVDISKKTLTVTDEEKALQEKQKQQEKDALDKAKKQKEEEDSRRDKELKAKLAAALKIKEEANQRALEEQYKIAEEEYLKALTDEQRKKYEEDKKKLENTPIQPRSPSVTLSSNANLSSMTLVALPEEGGSPIPVVLDSNSSAPHEYTANVGSNMTIVRVTPVVAESHAIVKVNDAYVISGSSSMSLTLGAEGTTTAINVVVTAEDGHTKQSYTIVVTRAPYYGVKYNDEKQRSKYLNFDSIFNSTDHENVLEVPINNFNIRISPKLAVDLNISNIRANNNPISLDQTTGYLIPLNVGINDIVINLSENIEGYYRLTVTRDSTPYGIKTLRTTYVQAVEASPMPTSPIAISWDPIAPNLFASSIYPPTNSIHVELQKEDFVNSVEISYNAATGSGTNTVKTVTLTPNSSVSGSVYGELDSLPLDNLDSFTLTMKDDSGSIIGMPQTFTLGNGHYVIPESPIQLTSQGSMCHIQGRTLLTMSFKLRWM